MSAFNPTLALAVLCICIGLLVGIWIGAWRQIKRQRRRFEQLKMRPKA